MVKKLLPAISFIVFLSSCSSFKSLNLTNNQRAIQPVPEVAPSKFIEEITVTPQPNAVDRTQVKPEIRKMAVSRGLTEGPAERQESNQIQEILKRRNASVENSVTEVQVKYASLLNTEPESLPNEDLLKSVDEWYGVRYRVGGNTKKGVDCSGFTVAVYASLYGIMLPRVSREQYRISRKISTTELTEGDLVFFDTRGGGHVSHVGIYLGNNKFIHASVSKGVMVNDLFQSYYLKRFIGAGRIDNKSTAIMNSSINP